MPEFVRRLRASGSSEVARLAFEFLVLTASRTSEVLGAKWSEVDTAEKVWTVPAHRMKAGRQHRVPLTARTIEILTRAQEIGGGSNYLFPGGGGTKPLSNMVFLMALRRMKLDITTHGFRSSFRDWAAEQTSFPREVCEMALAHVIENKVEAAYRRGDLFTKRRELMQAWDDFVSLESVIEEP